MDLAQDMQEHLNLSASLGVMLGHVERIQDTISSVELDVALLDSEMTDSDPESSANIHQKKQHLSTQLFDLTTAANQGYRNLYNYVLSYRSQVTDPEILSYFEELEELLQEYIDARGAGG